jgi:hypothetical protein
MMALLGKAYLPSFVALAVILGLTVFGFVLLALR